MNEIVPEIVDVGVGDARRAIAVLRRPGHGPGIFWLGGFRSDMAGAKAETLDRYGATHGLAVTRFDYSGHGQSGGTFTDGTISRWLEEALAVFATTTGPQLVVGSSMGGWLALLLTKALRANGQSRVRGLILIAPAVDMTDALMAAAFTPAERAALDANGFIEQPSAYGAPYVITRALIADGASHLMFGGPIEAGCPISILQGGRDDDVPKEHALKLVSHLLTDPVTFTLVPDGDHRLSRDKDLRLLERTLARALEPQD